MINRFVQTNIGSSIQEYCKKINSRLTVIDSISFFVVFVAVLTFTAHITYKESQTRQKVTYKESLSEDSLSNYGNKLNSVSFVQDARPFGSKKGKTYTFSWCNGSKSTSLKNKVYFVSSKDAESSGRTLSKLCKR
jgi:hypothetical protein